MLCNTKSIVCKEHQTTAVGPPKEGHPDVQQRHGAMDRRYPRCGVAATTAAAAALALLTNVVDVQGFAFPLQLPAKHAATAAATSKQRTFVGGGWGVSARVIHLNDQGRTSAIASRTSRNTRHARTAVRWEDARLTKENDILRFRFTAVALLPALDTTFKYHRFSSPMLSFGKDSLYLVPATAVWAN